jgi:hypothetical protein
MAAVIEYLEVDGDFLRITDYLWGFSVTGIDVEIP